MRVASTIRQLVQLCSGHLHGARQKSLLDAVLALARCGHVVAATLGRAMARNTSDKHGIKRMDRLLGNKALHRQRIAIYEKFAALTVGALKHPVVLIDWSSLGRDKYVLKAVLALRGRGVPLYAECHTLAANGKPSVQRRFLRRLRDILPDGCLPVIVTDAGFKQPWCAAVNSLGWHFITRVRGKTHVRVDAQSDWILAGDLPRLLGAGMHDLWQGQLNSHQPAATRLVVWDGRSKRARRRPRQKGRRIRVRRAVLGAHEGWLLATSMTTERASDIVDTYALRMQIELSLRDDKVYAMGWGLERTMCRTCARVDIQLLLIAIATIAALWVGLAAECADIARRFQANTERRRRVLSLVALGRRILSSRGTAMITADGLFDAIAALRNLIPRIDDFRLRICGDS